MRVRIYCNRPSHSALALSRETGIKRIKRNRSRYRERPTDVIINWGSSSLPFRRATVLNANSGVASNKLEAFLIMDGMGVENIPYFTTSYAEACDNISGKCVARTLLSSHSGRGVEVVDDVHELEGRSDVRLYLPYLKKKHEYRVHVANFSDGYEVFDIQQKRKRRDTPNEDVNYQVRNHGNGWIYARDEVEIDDREQLSSIAVDAVQALGLDWGAVDIIYNAYHNQYTILEVNTAVGLEGTTLVKYGQILERMVGEHV